MSAVIPTNIIIRRHRRSTTRTEFLSDVSDLLFASDFPKFGEEPNSGIGPPSACSHYFEYTPSPYFLAQSHLSHRSALD